MSDPDANPGTHPGMIVPSDAEITGQSVFGIGPTFIYRAVIRSVYDGDTLRADLDLGCGIWLRNEPIRLYGVDTPEVRGPEREAGLAVRDWVRSHLPEGTEVIIETIKDRKGKYGRYLGKVWVPLKTGSGSDHTRHWSLNETLLAFGMAKRFMV